MKDQSQGRSQDMVEVMAKLVTRCVWFELADVQVANSSTAASSCAIPISILRALSRAACAGPLSVRSPIAASASFCEYGSIASALTL